jgi:aminoglycoside 3-N-acetyltransferase
VSGTDAPRTRSSLAADLRELGLAPGCTVLVHCSLRSLGWVVGGAQAVVLALLDVLGPRGTIVVPTQSGDISDPRSWAHPPIPEHWWPVVRAEMPPFDPARTPSSHMGLVAEAVRTWPGALRSDHPICSFAALGAAAGRVVDVHDLDCSLGERSPLGTLDELARSSDVRVLFLGTTWGTCTAFHLAEYRQQDPPRIVNGRPVATPDGGQRWVEYTDIDLDERDFDRVGAAFEATGTTLTGPVGSAPCRLFALAEGVAFARQWLAENRATAGDTPGSS